ncbi:hypothetical protein N5P37_011210 [Trichoderma harzianum]|uniref:ABM domain-containing protein n=1 Tax=Trichoderma harzianum CBS 226.95 TaxID=983964 RepID=A0A2T3ZVW9_TRIHA|nr:hypothetical protein M431DRAFT_500621 [Trichoderma harzianum CBS 226.95]KAK0756295.1 hypothetical protein N5P37_011210 [Trichoderma harzianum]PKK54608.1 hypothetical protein CI102_870 [Trichoderma harzianum]PTB48957.1 hypothetical protein M431DRAFT_500621 [Trichoderma harzianum CBS 226.95]
MASQSMEIIMFDVQPKVIKETQSLLTNSEWDDALSTLKKQDGVRTAYWGQTIESQDKVYLLIDWISAQQCIKFKQSQSFKSFLTNLDLIILGSPRSIHVPIAPQMCLPIFRDGLTEIAIFSSYNSSFIETFDNFSSIIKNSPGCTGIMKDIARSEISGEMGEIEGSEQLYVAMIGWLDLEAHRIAMESKGFKDNVPSVEACVQEIIVYHIKMIMV